MKLYNRWGLKKKIGDLFTQIKPAKEKKNNKKHKPNQNQKDQMRPKENLPPHTYRQKWEHNKGSGRKVLPISSRRFTRLSTSATDVALYSELSIAASSFSKTQVRDKHGAVG